jgi:prepilin-type N-terminal cleavage/methylation domain-containing protein
MEARCLMSLLRARCTHVRRAFSFLELVAVIAMIGVVALAAGAYLGTSSLGNGEAEGFARKISLALNYARRSTISTGDNHYLQLAYSGGNVASYTLYRRAAGGDVQVDDTKTVPQDVTVTSAQGTLEFDFEGAALAAYNISVAGPNRSWSVAVVPVTGAIRVTETTP